MWALIVEFELILLVSPTHTGAIEPAVVEQAQFLGPRFCDGSGHVPGIFQAIDATNLASIICGDRLLDDTQSGYDELDNNFGIEMKIVGVEVERNLLQRSHRVDAITRV